MSTATAEKPIPGTILFDGTQARKGYALTEEAMQNSKDETLWCSPHCVPVVPELDLFSAMG